MIAVQILISFLIVLYLRSIFFEFYQAGLRRSSRDFQWGKVFTYPFTNLIHEFKTANLNLKSDAISIIKIILLHLSLVGIGSLTKDTAVVYSQAFIFLYIVILVIEEFQSVFLKSMKPTSSKQLIVAIVVLSSLASILAILLILGRTQTDSLGTYLASLYCLLLLFVGLAVRNSILPIHPKFNFYQKIEMEFGRFAWIVIFVALFSPAEVSRFTFTSFFMFKIILLEVGYEFIHSLIPQLNTDVRWSLIYQYAIPVALISAFGLFVSVVYV